MPAKTSEINLMKRIADGEESAFAQLYSSTSAVVYGYLMRITSNRDASDTLLILTFQHVWQHAEDFDQQFDPVNWVLKIARKLSLESDSLRKQSEQDSDTEQVKIAALDRQKSFIKAVESMSMIYRDPLALVLMRSFTYQTIAEIMGVKIDVAKTKVFDAKMGLNEKLKKLGIKKHQVSKSNILRELIPLYINGVLAGKHKVAFEKSLKNDPYLKQEYMEFYEIEEYFDQLNSASQQHLDQLYGALKNSLEDLDDEFDKEAVGERIANPKIDFLHHLLSSSRIGWGLAILQFAILIVVLIFVVPQYSNQVSAGIPSVQLLQQSKGKQLNIIFQDAATHQQIRDLLLSLELEMHSGPTDIGLYTVVIDGDEEQAAKVLNTLRKTEIILLADPAF
jgi:RNA polymerase sigma-70 factor (ECF subfamily)